MSTALQHGLRDEILLVLKEGPLTYEALKGEFLDVSREHFVSHLIELVEAQKICWTEEGVIDLRYPHPGVASSPAG